MIQNLQFDPKHPELGWTPAIPEPFWVRHWLFWSRPSCYTCRVKFKNIPEWNSHYLLKHAEATEFRHFGPLARTDFVSGIDYDALTRFEWFEMCKWRR